MSNLTIDDLKAEVAKAGIEPTTKIGGIDVDTYLATEGEIAKLAGLDSVTIIRKPGPVRKLTGAVAMTAVAHLIKAKKAKASAKKAVVRA